jgi:hypothetical protein
VLLLRLTVVPSVGACLDIASNAHNMPTLALMMGQGGRIEPPFTRVVNDRLDGNIPEDRGAHFGDRNLYFGGAYSWLASQIVDSD